MKVTVAFPTRGFRILAGLLVAVTLSPVVHSLPSDGQQPDEFDAVAVKRVERQPLYPRLDTDPGYLVARAASLHFLIRQAFGLEEFQLEQTSGWMKSELYSIHAVAGHSVSSAQMMGMLRALLASRFHLVFHRETRELPVYALVVDKNGPKIPLLGQGDASWSVKGSGGRVAWTIGSSIQDLVRYLNSRTGVAAVGLPVVDQTGLHELYKIQLILEDHLNADGRGGQMEIDYPTALPAQLGLRLKQTKAPVELMIVDSAQRPTLEE